PVNDTCCITGAKPLPPLPPGAQANKDRPGSDYSSFALGVADPSLCYNSCQADANCQSWSFVKPGFQGPSARCYLKNAIPFAVNNPCCVTGAKAAPPPPALPPGAQDNKDRPGNDYAATNLAVDDPNLCYNACQGDASCSAWSYVKPGFQGPTARCYLKTPAPVAVNNSCCVTGAKAVPPQPPGGLLELNSNRPGSDYANFPSGNGLLCLAACA